MTFTTMNILRAVREVESTDDLRDLGLGDWLRVPESKRREIESQFSSVPQQRKALINYFIDHDPVASWRAVIMALEYMGEKRVADELHYLAEPVTGRAGSQRLCAGGWVWHDGHEGMCVCSPLPTYVQCTCTSCCPVSHARPTLLLLTGVLTAHE